MSQDCWSKPPEIKELLDKYNALELRIRKMQDEIDAFEKNYIKVYNENEMGKVVVDNNVIEFNILEYGFAWFGSLVLLIGIVFLHLFIQANTGGVAASIIGFGSAGGVMFLSWYLRKTHPHLSFMLYLSSFLVLYYISMRLFFFSQDPVIPFKVPVVLLMAGVSIVLVFTAMRRRSELAAGFGILLLLVTSFISKEPYLSLPLIILSAGIPLFLFVSQGWKNSLLFSIIPVYGFLFAWLFSLPVAGYDIQVNSIITLFLISGIYSVVTLMTRKRYFPQNVYSSAVILNGTGLSIGLILFSLTSFSTGYFWIFMVVFVFCLFYSILLKYRTKQIFEPSYYAIYSFVALSIAIYGYYGLPDALWLLSMESLMVVSWALWFRSKNIIVINTILFVTVVLLSMFLYPSDDLVNFAFVVTAFISARIINWQKERLTLKTEVMRNTYLIVLFFTMLYALYNAVPQQYVTISWTFAALLYFVISLILNNYKYRRMAIATILFTGLYLFIFDLTGLETGYRVMAFFSLGALSLAASLYFTKRMKKKITG